MDRDAFGDGYMIVMKSMRVPPLTLSKEERQNQINKLFPLAPAQISHREITNEIPVFQEEELKLAAGRLKIRKAPGPDGVPAKAVKPGSSKRTVNTGHLS